MVTFRMTLLMNKWTGIDMDDGWVHPLTKTLPSLLGNLWRYIVMNDWNLDEHHLVSDSNYNNVNLQIPQKNYKEW